MRGPSQIVQVTSAAEVRPTRLAYFWKNRLAAGKITVIGGDPGVGKGLLGINVAASLTTGGMWPDGRRAPLSRVALLTGEDSPGDTIVPRLDVAGADLRNVHLIGRVNPADGVERRVSLDTDAEAVIRAAQESGDDVVIIDPLSSYLGANTNSWRDSDMRRVLDPLAEAATAFGMAVIVVVHLTKTGGSHALYRFQGSVATIAAARFGLLVAPHPTEPDLRVVASMKANLGKLPPSLIFRIVPRRHPDLEDDEIACIEWVGPSPLTADELLEKLDKKGTAQDRAERFLREYLAAGEAPSETVKAAARQASIGRDSLWEAKGDLGVIARKDGLGKWHWKLPFEALVDQYGSGGGGQADQYASVQAEPSWSDPDGSVRFSSNQASSLRSKEEERIIRSVLKRSSEGDAIPLPGPTDDLGDGQLDEIYRDALFEVDG